MSNKFSQKDGFTKLAGTEARRTLAQKLIKPADRLRDLNTKFGRRVYSVTLYHTRWTGRVRGQGTESIIFAKDILPTPLIIDMGTLQEVATVHGLDEAGSIQMNEVSGRFTEDMLLGIDSEGREPLDTDNVFFEIEFPRKDGRMGERRRFELRSAPSYVPDQFQWHLTLGKIDENRDRDGNLR